MFNFRKRLMLLIVFLIPCNVGYSSATAPTQPPPDSTPPSIPVWATSRLDVHSLGGSLERLAAYGDQLLPNLGALAKTSVAQRIFSPMPLGEGLNGKKPAIVFTLDPTATKGREETAMILPVSNAKELKESLALNYETEEKDGIITLSVPQGFDKPEKIVKVRIGAQRAFVAPNLALLKQLETFASEQTGTASASTPSGDFNLSIRLDTVRRLYQKKAETFLAAQQFLLPAMGLNGLAIDLSNLSLLAELERLDIRATFLEGSLSLTGSVKAKANTSLSKLWSKKAPALKSTVLGMLPGDLVFHTHLPAQNLFWTGMQILSGSGALMNTGSEAMDNAIKNLRKAILTLSKNTEGDTAFGTRPDSKGSVEAYFALESSQPHECLLAFEGFLHAIAKVETEQARAHLKESDEAFTSFSFKKLESKKVGAWKVTTFKWEPGGLPDQQSVGRDALAATIGWPVLLHIAETPTGILLLMGKNPDEHFAAMAKVKDPMKLGSLAAVKQSKQQLAGAKTGTDLLANVQLISFIRMLAFLSQDPEVKAVDAILKSIPNGPLSTKIQTGSNQAALTIDLPAASVQGLLSAYLRLRNSKLSFSTILDGFTQKSPKKTPTPSNPE